jgi:hypothetical protein
LSSIKLTSIQTEKLRWTMAVLSRRITTYSDGTYQLERFDLVQWYQQREDREVFGSIRACAPCPAVFVMKDDPHVKMTQQWQYYLRAINYHMDLEDVYLILDRALAFANQTGFRNSSSPKADYFHNKDLSYPLPSLDKVRTTSRSVLTGVEEFDYPTFTYDGQNLLQRLAARLLAPRVSNLLQNKEPVLHVKVFDSRDLPPLKPGYSYPNDISEVDPNAYAIMPETHPEMFLVANIVNNAGEVVQFPRGATYPWIDSGLTPYTFVPHIANLSYGEIKYPLRYLYKVPLGSARPRALRYEN